jgi:hypothetical protein
LKTQIIFTTSFFLLIITVLGTAIYGYLRKEQDKFIPPKDVYDEAWNEVFRKKRNKIMGGACFNWHLGKWINSEISLGFGGLSCLIYLFSPFILPVRDYLYYYTTFSFIGSIAALSGFFIGVFGAFRARNVSPLMRYGGVILCIGGFVNILPLIIMITVIIGSV